LYNNHRLGECDMRKNSTLQKYTILAVVLVFVIVLVGFGMSYAFCC